MNNKMVNALKAKESLLNSVFLKKAKRFRNDLIVRIKDRRKIESIYADFLDMLISAQKEEKSFEDTIPDYAVFLKSCVESEKQNNIVFQKIVKFRRPILSVLATTLTVVLVFVYLFSSGYMSLWQHGIQYIASSEKYEARSFFFEKEMKFDIYLNGNTDLNYGKEIYNDGVNRIVVESVGFTMATVSNSLSEEVELENLVYLKYTIDFKCEAVVSRNLAQIVCGRDYATTYAAPHITIDDEGTWDQNDKTVYSYTLGGKEYRGHTENSPTANFKNSAQMIIYVTAGRVPVPDPPLTAEETAKVDALWNAEKITIKLSGLVLNQWIRK